MSSLSSHPKVKPIYHSKQHASIGDIVMHANLIDTLPHLDGDQLYLVIDLLEECTGVETDESGELIQNTSWFAHLLSSDGKTFLNVCYLSKICNNYL